MQQPHKPLRRHKNVTPQGRLFIPFRASHRPAPITRLKCGRCIWHQALDGIVACLTWVDDTQINRWRHLSIHNIQHTILSILAVGHNSRLPSENVIMKPSEVVLTDVTVNLFFSALSTLSIAWVLCSRALIVSHTAVSSYSLLQATAASITNRQIKNHFIFRLF